MGRKVSDKRGGIGAGDGRKRLRFRSRMLTIATGIGIVHGDGATAGDVIMLGT